MALIKVDEEFVRKIESEYRYLHTASNHNYVGKDCYAKAEPYRGYFGHGWKIYFRNPYSRNTCFVKYYIKED